jgi:hypothetical protein
MKTVLQKNSNKCLPLSLAPYIHTELLMGQCHQIMLSSIVASRGSIFPCFLLVSRVWDISLNTAPLLLIGWKILQTVRQRLGNLTTHTLYEAPEANQSASIMDQLYITSDKWGGLK